MEILVKLLNGQKIDSIEKKRLFPVLQRRKKITNWKERIASFNRTYERILQLIILTISLRELKSIIMIRVFYNQILKYKLSDCTQQSLKQAGAKSTPSYFFRPTVIGIIMQLSDL